MSHVSQEEDAGDKFAKADPKTRTTVRNLRNREDRAKYLHNLDLDSAYYDPKSRSMRENPYDGTGAYPKLPTVHAIRVIVFHLITRPVVVLRCCW